MSDPYFQQLFAQRIGGVNYGKSTRFTSSRRSSGPSGKHWPTIPSENCSISASARTTKWPTRRSASVMAEEINEPENRGYADNGIPEFKEAAAG